MGQIVTQPVQSSTSGTIQELSINAVLSNSVIAGDLLAGSHYDSAPKPLFPRSLMPASFPTAKSPTDSIYSALTTATLSTSHNQMSVCPTASGGMATLVGSGSSAANVSLFVFSDTNTLISNTTPITSLQVNFNNGDQNFGLAELTSGAFVLAWKNTAAGTCHIQAVSPLGGGVTFGPTSLGTSNGVAVCAAADGGFYVLLMGASPALSKYNAAGTQQCTKAGVGANNSNNRAVIELANGNVVAVYGATRAIYDPAGALISAAATIPGILGNESTAAPLAGSGFAVASRTNGGGNFQHTILSDAGTVLYQTTVPGAIGCLRTMPAGGYVADASNGTTFYGYSSIGKPSGATPGSYFPLPLADGKVASVRLNSAASQLVTEIFAGSGSVYGVATATAAAGATANIKVMGSATTRLVWNNGGGGFNHGNKVPGGNRGMVFGQTALLEGF